MPPEKKPLEGAQETPLEETLPRPRPPYRVSVDLENSEDFHERFETEEDAEEFIESSWRRGFVKRQLFGKVVYYPITGVRSLTLKLEP